MEQHNMREPVLTRKADRSLIIADFDRVVVPLKELGHEAVQPGTGSGALTT
jgi:hypothetical protein